LTTERYKGDGLWTCRCDCGAEATVSAGRLRTGKGALVRHLPRRPGRPGRIAGFACLRGCQWTTRRRRITEISPIRAPRIASIMQLSLACFDGPPATRSSPSPYGAERAAFGAQSATRRKRGKVRNTSPYLQSLK